ncbi:hypothetical protein LINGRAPRIM_LOCUS2435 [Linum grandiflorum]
MAIQKALFTSRTRQHDRILIYSELVKAVLLITDIIDDIRVGLLLQECRHLLYSLHLVTLSHIRELDNKPILFSHYISTTL